LCIIILQSRCPDRSVCTHARTHARTHRSTCIGMHMEHCVYTYTHYARTHSHNRCRRRRRWLIYVWRRCAPRRARTRNVKYYVLYTQRGVSSLLYTRRPPAPHCTRVASGTDGRAHAHVHAPNNDIVIIIIIIINAKMFPWPRASQNSARAFGAMRYVHVRKYVRQYVRSGFPCEFRPRAAQRYAAALRVGTGEKSQQKRSSRRDPFRADERHPDGEKPLTIFDVPLPSCCVLLRLIVYDPR
jgi:hypothetical protein